MPGLFATIDCEPEVAEAIKGQFDAVWPGTLLVRTPIGAVGAHAHQQRQALFERARPEQVVGVDGELALYATATVDEAGKVVPPPCMAPGAENHSCPAVWCGNVAVLCLQHSSLTLQTDPTGSFPLYFARVGKGVAVSSLLRPLAALLAPSPDELAIIEFVRTGYIHNGRTLFRNISRLLPGQRLHYDGLAGRLSVQETSELWSAGAPQGGPGEQIWQSLESAVDVLHQSDERVAIMLSGGWDSRTLLAAFRDLGQVSAYHHGDLESRETSIVTAICNNRQLPLRCERLVPDMFGADVLGIGFPRVENAIFAHWHRAGKLLQQEGTDCVTAAVFGEILGGHYGAPMVSGTGGKVMSFFNLLLRGSSRPSSGTTDPLTAAAQGLLPRRLGIDWCLASDFVGAHEERLGDLSDAIRGDLERLRDRGIADPDALVEAFISEHRGAHYINAQLLSCRAWTDIALPLANPHLLRVATSLPLQARLHNRLNRSLLMARDRELLQHPLAATLVPAAAPLLIQEASRVARRLLEGAIARTSLFGGKGLRLGWANLTPAFHERRMYELADDLRAPFWRKDSLLKAISDVASDAPQHRSRAHPIFDMLGKILTVDRTLRSSQPQ
jgi:hypothetical protein